MPIDHTGFPVPHSKVMLETEFCIAALAPLGYKKVQQFNLDVVGIGDPRPDFWIFGIDANMKPFPDDMELPSLHIAFVAETRKQVHDFYDAAIKAGGKDNGKPGLREMYGPTYYAAFVHSPCGHNIEVVHRKGEETS